MVCCVVHLFSDNVNPKGLTRLCHLYTDNLLAKKLICGCILVGRWNQRKSVGCPQGWTKEGDTTEKKRKGGSNWGRVIQQLVDEFGLKWEGLVSKRWLLFREGGEGRGLIRDGEGAN